MFIRPYPTHILKQNMISHLPSQKNKRRGMIATARLLENHLEIDTDVDIGRISHSVRDSDNSEQLLQKSLAAEPRSQMFAEVEIQNLLELVDCISKQRHVNRKE